MDARDRRLGMDRAISRRDFVNGVGVAIGASLLPACAREQGPETEAPVADAPAGRYPPTDLGMRGSHPGSFEAAHATVEGQRWTTQSTGEHYDLVVVGAGISGLSAAYIYRRDVNPDARILILDNHDDFGGHAKRNEFEIDGRTLLCFGGTMFIEAPHTYPAVSKQVIRELGIDIERRAEVHDRDFAGRHGLARGTFFDRETFGEDFLAVGESLDGAPLSATARDELERLERDEDDYLDGMTEAERLAVLQSMSWSEFLGTHGGFGAEALVMVQKRSHGVWAIGADALPAWMAWATGYPGFAGFGRDNDTDEADQSERNFRFPDGNASVARLLVRKLIPGMAPGHTMEDVVTARFDYSKLDEPGNQTRIRLNSTVVEMRHRDGNLDGDVDIAYVGDAPRRVTANKVIWAGYHAMVPHICPDMPAQQRAAQGSSVRAPLVYTNVLIRNWQSLKNLGLTRAYCPGSFFSSVRITNATNIGDYRFPESPDEPIVLHLQHIPLAPGLSAPDQFRAGRQALLETPFATFERNVRDQLGRILGAGGFDPARDIAGIVVNRWPHGYAYSVDEASGDVAWYPSRWEHGSRPWEEASRRVGNIAFAGTDAASNAMTESAIEEAHRSVHALAEAGADVSR